MGNGVCFGGFGWERSGGGAGGEFVVDGGLGEGECTTEDGGGEYGGVCFAAAGEGGGVFVGGG